MMPSPNFAWKCGKCGKEIFVYQEEGFPQSEVIKKCDCGGEMKGGPIIHRGPSPIDAYKKS